MIICFYVYGQLIIWTQTRIEFISALLTCKRYNDESWSEAFGESFQQVDFVDRLSLILLIKTRSEVFSFPYTYIKHYCSLSVLILKYYVLNGYEFLLFR